MGIVLEKEDEKTLQLQNFALSSSKRSGKSTYASWIMYSNGGEGN